MGALLNLDEVEVRRGMGVVLHHHSLRVDGAQYVALVGSNRS
jgi:ABC-type branched-subunit amino acid transport system ATPase component